MPAAVKRVLTADVAQEIAETFGDNPVYPRHILVDSPAEPSLRWAGTPPAYRHVTV